MTAATAGGGRSAHEAGTLEELDSPNVAGDDLHAAASGIHRIVLDHLGPVVNYCEMTGVNLLFLSMNSMKQPSFNRATHARLCPRAPRDQTMVSGP